MVVWMPWLVGSAIVSGAVNSVFNYRTAKYSYDYNKLLMNENTRFWKDYEKNTGVLPRYPYRSGYNFNQTSLYGAQATQYGALNSVVNSMLYGSFIPYAREQARAYRPQKYTGYDYMYM